MSQDNRESPKRKKKSEIQSFERLREASPKPVGPEKPWDKESQKEADDMVENFLADSGNKKRLKDFVVNTFKELEREAIDRVKARFESERAVDSQRMVDHHAHGNITPIMMENLNMHDAERSFARGLTATKKSLVRTLEDRVEEVNRLLAGIGGFSANLKASFARSTVVFLEQEDPKHTFRERLIFSINLPNYELKHKWSNDDQEGSEQGRGRTQMQATWDDAVNALARIIESTGLKPKFCKNDRAYGRFVMKQDLRSSTTIPDEYFSFTLDYNTPEKIRDMRVPYAKILRVLDSKIVRFERKIAWYASDSTAPRLARLKKKHLQLVQERDYFMATTPDPNQIEEGLLFLIEVSTLKDYHIVKDRMQSIMTKYILHLSEIAEREADFDPDLEFHRWQNQQHGVGKKDEKLARGKNQKQDARELRVLDPAAMGGGGSSSNVREFIVDESALMPRSKVKKAA